MLREPADPPTVEPKQSGSFRYLQGMLEAGEGGKTPAALPPWLPASGGAGRSPTLGTSHPTSLPSAPPPSSPHVPTLLAVPPLSRPLSPSSPNLLFSLLVFPEAGPSPTPAEVKFFLFLTSICRHPAHATRTSAFRGAVWAWQPAEPQTRRQQAGHPTEWPAGAARVHALRPRHRVSIPPAFPTDLSSPLTQPDVLFSAGLPSGAPLSRRGTSCTTPSASCAATAA